MKNDAQYLSRLKWPDKTVDVVVDTDTYNEIDDQFALSYLLRSQDKLRVKAIYAAPFLNRRAVTAEEGMERSYQEIFKLLSLLNRSDMEPLVYRGSRTFHPNEETPVYSDAAKDLVERAMNYTPENPLYVIAIAAITNVSSALLMNPEIAERIVVIWLGGEALDWPHNREFNCYQDVAGARILMQSEVPVVLLPCMGVVSECTTTKYELEHWLKGQNPLCDYLYEEMMKEARESKRNACWSKALWDVCAVAWLLDQTFMDDRYECAPLAEYDHRWAKNPNGKLIKYVYHIYRDRVMLDLFEKLRGTSLE